MLTLKNLTMQYNKQENEVLKNINLKFADTGLIFIVGESGSGKSTLLNLIGLLAKPKHGKIFLDDKEITKYNSKDIDLYHRNVVSFIYQSYNLIEYLNVYDNVSLVNQNKKTDYLLKKLKIFNKKNINVKKLSGGEQERVAIARAIIKQSRIILADEPTGALDKLNSISIIRELKSISKDKLVIVVSHDMSLANRFADRIITLEDGKVIDDIIKNDIHKGAFISKLDMNRNKSSKTIFTIVKKHFKYKFKRNMLSLIAICIGLISLALVIGLSSGFKQIIAEEEKSSLAEYPLIISKNVDSTLNYNDHDNHESDLYINKYLYNDISLDYVSSLDNIKNDVSNMIFTFSDLVIYNYITYPIDTQLIISGNIPQKNNELLLIVNDSCISNDIVEYFELKEDDYRYDDLIGRRIGDMEIVGIVDTKDTYFSEIQGVFTIDESFLENTPDIIYIFPLNYEKKLDVLDFLNKNPDISYVDYSQTIKNFS